MKFILLTTAFLAVASAYELFYFTPSKNEEVVYKYYANVDTRVNDPELYGSKFSLRGDLHIRNDLTGNGAVFWLKNVEISTYNGVIANYKTATWVPLPELAKAYLIPFYVEYTEDGIAQDVLFQQGEPDWVFNIKKGIASTFQFDWTKMMKYHKKTPFAFQTYENTIYGRCHVGYEVIPGEELCEVTKYFNPRECEGFTEMSYTNAVSHQCFVDHDDIFKTVAERKFFVTKDGVIKKVTANSMAFVNIFKIQENTQALDVNQKFKFVEFVKPTTEIDFKSFVTKQPIVYTRPKFSKKIPDLTFGFYKFDKDHYVKQVRSMLIESIHYMEMLPITEEVPTVDELKDGQLLSRIYYILRMFELSDFEQVYQSFYKSTDKQEIRALEIFYKILPNIGTYYSAVFVRDLIANQKVKDYVASQLLYTLGVNMPHVSEEYLADFEVFYTWDVPTQVKHASILTFASMVHNAFEETPHDTGVEKYIKYYYNQLKTASVYEEQVIWLQGLSNIRVGTVFDLLRPIVFGEQVLAHPYDHHLRAQAIWSMLHVMEDLHIDVFDTFWPVLVDETLHLELRVAALKSIIQLGDLSEQRFVFQWIQDHQNIHLYNFFYHTVRDVAHSHLQCNQRDNRTIFFEQLEQIFADSPIEASTTAFVRDTYDEETGYGFYFYGNAIANEKTNHVNQVFLKYSEIIAHEMSSSFGISIKFEGIEYPVDTFFSDLFTFNIDTFKGKLFQRSGEPIHVEIIIMYFDQIIFSRYFDAATIEKLFNADFVQLLSLLKFKYSDVFFTLQKEVYFPTDFGVTANYFTIIPLGVYFRSDVPLFKTEATQATINYESYFRVWSHSSTGLSVYNPLSAMVQGVRRFYNLDISAPFNFELTIDYDDSLVHTVSRKQKDDLHNIFGVKTYTTSQAYVYTDRRSDVLALTCASCESMVIATNKNHDFKYNSTIFEYHNRFFGSEYYFGIYEADYAPQDFKTFGFPMVHFDYDSFHNLGDYSFQRYLLSVCHWFISNAFIHPRGNFGFVLYSKPCELYPATVWDWTTYFHREPRSRLSDATFLDYDYIVNSTVETRNGKEVVTTYDMGFNFSHYHGQVFNDFTSLISRKVEGNDEYHNYCFNRNKFWHSQRVTVDYDFWYGTAFSRQCVKDDFYVQIQGYAEKSEEQLNEAIIENPRHTYSACRPHLPWHRRSWTHTYQCALAYESLRKVHYSVKMEKQIPYLDDIQHFLITAYKPRFLSEPYKFLVDNTLEIDIVYPVDFHERTVSVVVTFPTSSLVFDKFPVNKYGVFAYPDNPFITSFYQFAKYFNHYNSCVVYPTEPEYVTPHLHLAPIPTSKEWTLYAANAPKNYTWAVYVQKFNDDDIAIKFVFNDGWVIVKPSHSRFSIETSDQFFKYFVTDYSGFNYNHVQMWYVHDTVLFTLPDYGMIWKYNGEGLYLFSVDTEHQYYGVCYQ
jgi:GC-rich sequence DNA-binding factor